MSDSWNTPREIVGRLVLYVVVVLVGAVLCGIAGAMWYVFLPTVHQPRRWHGRSRQREYTQEVALHDRSEDMSRRFWIGSGIGAVLGLGVSGVIHVKMKSALKHNYGHERSRMDLGDGERATSKSSRGMENPYASNPYGSRGSPRR
jgi:hypothetical protein